MATFSVTVTHDRSSDYKGRESDSTRLVCNKISTFFQGLGGGVYQGSTIEVSQDAATGTVTLSNVGGTAATGAVTLNNVAGTAASNTVTLGGGAGNVTIVTDGTSVGPVAFNTSDAQTALDAITALNANGTFAAKATASSGGSAVVRITWNTKGTVGNSKTLTASRTAGTATVGGNGTTLGGGGQGSVTITINDFPVVTDTTTLSNSAAATACAASIEADPDLGPLLTAIGDGADVEITWGTKGISGNEIPLEATSVTGTATVSDVTLTGGLDNDVTVTIGGVAVVTDTTNLSNMDAATAVAAEITADSGAADLVTASAASNVVTLTAVAAGEEGNGISLTAITDAGTATASGANLSGGTSFSYTL